MTNLISTIFSPADETIVMDLLAQIKAKFPDGIKLSIEQKRHMPQIDDTRIPFVDKGLSFGEQQPMIVPPFIVLGELKKDIDFVKSTRRVGAEILSLAEMITDTRTAAGYDAYQAALSIYSSSKAAAKQGIPGTQTIVDEMGKLFDGQRNNARPVDVIS